MEAAENQNTEEEIVELVAEALTGLGFSAGSQETGGGICCVVLEREGGGSPRFTVWGSINWELS